MKLVKENFSFCFLILFLFQNIAFGQLSSKNGETYTTEITVKFKTKAFDKTDAKGLAVLKDLKTNLKSVKDFFQKYGEVQFWKSFVNGNWGDTIKYDLKGKAVKVPDLSQFYSITFPEPVKMWETVYALRKLPEIEFADPPTFIVSDETPDDLNGEGNQWNLSKVNATSAWDIITGSSSVIVAVIDEGVDASHEDLSSKITGGESGYYGGTENHGTRVAGVVGAATDNGTGIASLGWNIMIKPYNYNNGSGSAQDIITAVDSGAHILNCSWRTVAIDPNDNTKYINYNDGNVSTAIQYAVNLGRIVVAAAGNPPVPIRFSDNITRDPSEYPPYTIYPASYTGVIGVSATNSSDQFPSGYNYGSFVDVCAPSVSILTTGVGDNYPIVSGTSFGSPLVAALAGLILSKNSSLTSSEVANIILLSVDDLGSAGWDDHFGYGRINAGKAVRNLYVPQIYTTVQGAINFATTGQVVIVASGTYTENLSMKAGVTVKGAGMSSTTINGTVTFYSDDGAGLEDAAVNDFIDVDYSDDVYLSKLDLGSSGFITITGSNIYSPLFMLIAEGTLSWAISALSGSTITIEGGSFRNKADEAFYFGDNSYGDFYATEFCSNTYNIRAAYSSYAYVSGCTFSSSQEGNSVEGDVYWDDWDYCGGMRKVASGSEKGLSQTFCDPALDEYKTLLNKYTTLTAKIRKDKKERKALESYSNKIDNLIAGLKQFIEKYNTSKYAPSALGRITAILRMFERDEELSSYLNEVSKNNELKPYAENALIALNIKNANYTRALNQSDELLSEYPDHLLAVEWLYGKGLIYKYVMNEKTKAEEMFKEVIAKYPEHVTARSAKAQLGIKEEYIPKEKLAVTETQTEFTTQNYPNPFNPTTTISYTLPADDRVQIKVFDVLGREVTTLLDAFVNAGKHSITWDGSNSASGIYFYSVAFKGQMLYKKIMMMK